METCKTLGADLFKRQESHYFKFSYSHNNLQLEYGFSNPTQQKVIINDGLIKQVILRAEYLEKELPERVREVGYYSLSHWNDCPNTVYCPYIAKLVLDVFPTETIDRILKENQE